MSSIQERLKTIANDGAFGAGRALRVVNSSDNSKGEQFQSELMFLQVDLVPDSGSLIKIPVVVKTQLKDPNLRETMETAVQFINEVAMYKTVLPKLGAEKYDIAPKMYFGEANGGKNPDRDIIVLEDLRPLRYKVIPETWIDYDHLSLAMKKLGQFHGLSYQLKKSSPEIFKELIKSFQPKTAAPVDEKSALGSISRAFQPLVDNNPSYSIVNRTLKKITSRSAAELYDRVQKPEEPFAVIVHGDFNKNNVLYIHDENGKVVDMKMFDFAWSKYGDPIMDISFFLYLNTSPDMRKDHWNDFLTTYWAGVSSVIEDPGFTYDEFLVNFSRKAISGFLPCSFYLPLLLHPDEFDQDEFSKMTPEQQCECILSLGGESGTEVIASIVRHLLESGYLEEFLHNLEYD